MTVEGTQEILSLSKGPTSKNAYIFSATPLTLAE